MLQVLILLALLCSIARAETGMSVQEARALAVQAEQHELLYLGSERRYTCTYQVTVRTYSAGSYSRPPIYYTADLFSSNAGELLSDIVPSETVAKVPKAHQFRVTFPTDVLASVLQHSLLEAIEVDTRVSRTDGTERTFVRFTFRGDPDFTPQTYVETVAHALSGRMVLDATDALLVLVNGVAAEDAVHDGRLVVPKGIPLLDFQAALFKGVFLPLRFSAASFAMVPEGPRAQQRWNEHLTRSFGQRQSCQEFHVKSTIRGAATEERPAPQ